MELMVSISILLIISVGGVVYLNKFNDKQKLDKAQNDLISMIKMSQNYAKVKQSPVGSVESVKFVQLYKTAGGNIEAKNNDAGTLYFSNKTSDVTITFNPGIFYFWGGTGRLSKDNNSTFFGPNEKANITITFNQGVAETRVVVVNYLGGVE